MTETIEDPRIPLTSGSIIKISHKLNELETETISYFVEECIASGGQALLYKCKNSVGHPYCIKEYYPFDAIRNEESDDKEIIPFCGWDDIRNGLQISQKLARSFASASHQAFFLPIDADDGRMVEVMPYATNDCCTLAECVARWDSECDVSSETRVKKAVQIVDSLLTVLIKLHEFTGENNEFQGLVHGDINPGNILWAENDDHTGVAFPIDFSCCSEKNGNNSDCKSFSPGYSHPYLTDASIQVDLYGVAAVLVFLTKGSEIYNIFEDLNLPDLTDEWTIWKIIETLDIPAGVKRKLGKIIQKATTLEENEQYSSAYEMREEIKVLLEIIDRKGMHPEVLFDASDEVFREQKSKRGIFHYKMERDLLVKAIDCITKEPVDLLAQNTILIGGGGSGKTTTVRDLWGKALDLWKEDPKKNPIPIFVPLNTFDGSKDRKDFIKDYIVKHYFRNLVKGDNDRIGDFLNLLRNGCKFLFLLDGINEAVGTDKLNEEVAELAALENVTVLITSRNDWGDDETKKLFSTAELLPLNDDLVIKKLQENELGRLSQRLLETLRRPMFLALYLKLKITDKQVETPGQILREHHKYLIDSYKTGHHGESWELAVALTMDEILPEFSLIVDRMVFNRQEARQIIDTLIEQRTGENANYRDAQTFLRSEGIELDAFSLEVFRACGLIQKSGKEEYAFTHENYLQFYKTLKIYKKILNKILPDKPMKHAVRCYLGDLLGEYAHIDKKSYAEEASPVEKLLKYAGREPDIEKRQMAIAELIEVMKAARQNRITGCFDGLDLSLADFSYCDLTGSSFDYTVLPDAAFLPFPNDKILQYLDLCHPIPNSTWAISTNRGNNKLYLWDFSQNMICLVHVIKLGIEPIRLAVSPDGKKVAVRDRRYIEVYDLKSRKYLHGLNANNNIIISPKKEKVLESLDLCSKIYFNGGLLLKFAGNNSLIFNDGTYIARANLKGKYQNIYVLSGSNNENSICDCEVLSDKNRIFFLTDKGKIFVHSLKMGIYLNEYTLPALPEPRWIEVNKTCDKIQVSPNQKNIYVECNYGTDAVFLRCSGNEVRPFTSDGRIYGGCVSDDYFVQYDKSSLFCRHAKDGSINFIKELENIRNVYISTDEKILFVKVAPNKIKLYNLGNGEQICVFRTGLPQADKRISSHIAVDGGKYSYRLSNGDVYLIGSSNDRLTLPSSTTCFVYYDDEYYFVETPGKSLEIWSLSSRSRELLVDTHSIFLSHREAPYFAQIKYLPSHQKLVVVTLEGFIWIWNKYDRKWKMLNILNPLRDNKGRVRMRTSPKTMCKVIGDHILSVTPRGDILQWDLAGRCVSHTKQPLDAEGMIPVPEQKCCMILIKGKTNERYSVKTWDLEQKCFLERPNVEEVYEFGDEEITPRNIWDFVRYDSRILHVPKSIDKHELVEARIEAGILVFAPNACISRNIAAIFDSRGVFSIYDKETGSLLRKIVLEITKNEILRYELSKSGDTLLVRFANDSIKIFGVFDHNLDKTIPLLLPDCVSNCDFSKAILSNELKEALIQSDSTVIF